MRLIHATALVDLVVLVSLAGAEAPRERTQPAPTESNVAYGEQPRQVLDFYRAESEDRTPVVFYVHGGGWTHGDKRNIRKQFIDVCLDNGISVVSINYRYTSQAEQAGVKPPVSWPMQDAARALQFVRFKADDWNIDKRRIGASGTSAGACTSLWLAFHDEMAATTSSDPIERESTRLRCAAVYNAQTSLDPKQMQDWIPNSRYGGHAFGITKPIDSKERNAQFRLFLDQREQVLPWIEKYSPFALASADDPPTYLLYKTPPDLGHPQEDPTHSANFGVHLQEKLEELSVESELVYPGPAGIEHESMEAFLIDRLRRIRIALAGDSTVCIYPPTRPERGWGMFMEELFQDGSVEVLNFAKSGRSTKTFIREGFWKMLKASNPDYVLIQFGHNDSHAPENPESTDAATDYRAYLRQYIEDSRAIGATPILVTPMVRRTFGEDGKLTDNLLPYANAMKVVGREMKVPVIDLHESSWKLVEPLGPNGSATLANRRGDNTHFNEKGARTMAGLVGAELTKAAPKLAEQLREQ